MFANGVIPGHDLEVSKFLGDNCFFFEYSSKKIKEHRFLLEFILNTPEYDSRHVACVDYIYLIHTKLPMFTILKNIVNVLISYTEEVDDDKLEALNLFMKKNISSNNTKLRWLVGSLYRELCIKKLNCLKDMYITEKNDNTFASFLCREPLLVKAIVLNRPEFTRNKLTEYFSGKKNLAKLNFVECLINQFSEEKEEVLQRFFSSIISNIIIPNIPTFNFEHRNTLHADPESQKLVESVFESCNQCLIKLFSIISETRFKDLVNCNTEFALTEREICIVNFLCELVVSPLRQEGPELNYICDFIIENNQLLPQFVNLLKCKNLSVKVSALNALKSIIQTDTNEKVHYLFSQSVINTILNGISDNFKNKNILYSSCLAFLDFIKTKNRKKLIKLFADEINKNYRRIIYINTVASLILKSEQNSENVKMEFCPDSNSQPLNDTNGSDLVINAPLHNYPRCLRPSKRKSSSNYSDMIDPIEEEYFNSCEEG